MEEGEQWALWSLKDNGGPIDDRGEAGVYWNA
jgi:hypothetical protein